MTNKRGQIYQRNVRHAYLFLRRHFGSRSTWPRSFIFKMVMLQIPQIFPCVSCLGSANVVQCPHPKPKIGDKSQQIPHYSVCPRGQPPRMVAGKCPPDRPLALHADFLCIGPLDFLGSHFRLIRPPSSLKIWPHSCHVTTIVHYTTVTIIAPLPPSLPSQRASTPRYEKKYQAYTHSFSQHRPGKLENVADYKTCFQRLLTYFVHMATVSAFISDEVPIQTYKLSVILRI